MTPDEYLAPGWHEQLSPKTKQLRDELISGNLIRWLRSIEDEMLNLNLRADVERLYLQQNKTGRECSESP